MAIHCPSAPTTLDRLQKEADALTKLKEEMDREFEGILSQDLQTLAEGEKNPAFRGTAVKLAFSKNRLLKKLEAKEKEQTDLIKEYCKGCAPDKKATNKVAKFCEFCEDASRCPEDKI